MQYPVSTAGVTLQYVVGPKGAKARTGTGHTSAQWAAVVQAVGAAPNGLTLAALKAVLVQAGQHPSGAAYFVRMAWLVPYVAPAKPASK